MFRYFLASLLFVLVGCATINLQSVDLTCPNLPSWALISLVACAGVSSVGFVISEWMSISKKTEANGIIQYLAPVAIALFSWIKAKLSKGPPEPSS